MITNIYKKPEILNKELHKDTKLSPYKDYSFSQDAYLVPISLEEALIAMKSLLVVFIKEDTNKFVPAVILGTKETKNLLITDNNWKKGTYIPASIRAYPFGIGTTKNNNETFITLDSASDILENEDGYNIFDEDLNFTKNGQHAISFVQKIYSEIDKSREFTSHIDSLGLLKNATLTIEKDGEKYELDNIFVIDEPSLNKLESRKLKKLATSNYMKYIYAHLFSLNNKY